VVKKEGGGGGRLTKYASKRLGGVRGGKLDNPESRRREQRKRHREENLWGGTGKNLN